ncbi:uncharacterized protein L199_005109 [Kwoniella botswanensis]|uniref:uncharacterized protein n=1 Tax=Kwoniella botswanensis TaxID=1268659 RepID=UPI00315CDA41
MCWCQGHKQEEWHLKTLYLRVTGSKKLDDHEKGMISVIKVIGVLWPRLEDLPLGRFEEEVGKMMDGLPTIGTSTPTGEWECHLVPTGTGDSDTPYSLQESLDEMALPETLRIIDLCIVLKIPPKRPSTIIPRQRDYYCRNPFKAMMALLQRHHVMIFLPNLQEGSVWEIHKSVDGREDGWLRWSWRKTPQPHESDPALATSNIFVGISPVLYTKCFTSNYRSGGIGRFLPEDEDDDSD